MSADAPTYRLPDAGAVINDLPKVSLHDHLDGGLRPATIIELAAAAGVSLPTTDPAELGQWFADQSNSGSLVEYLKTFDVTTSVMQTAPQLTRIAREFVEDLVADGVVYGEVRWAPEQHLQGGLTLDQTVEAVQAGIEEAVDAAGGRIRVGQLVTAMRHADRSLEIAELAVRHRDAGVVGFDIAGAEAGFPASNHRAAFDYLASELFPVTVHAGEADGLDSHPVRPRRRPGAPPRARRPHLRGRRPRPTPGTARRWPPWARSPRGSATARSRSRSRRRRTCRPARSPRGATTSPTTRSTCSTSSASASRSTPTTA